MSGPRGWRDDEAAGEGLWSGYLCPLPLPQESFVTRPQLCDVGLGLMSASSRPVLSCLRAAVRSGTNAFQRKEMENYLFPQKCITGGWLSSSHTSWAINIILALLCGLGLFFLLLSFQPNASLPPRTKHRNSRKVRNPWPRPSRV